MRKYRVLCLTPAWNRFYGLRVLQLHHYFPPTNPAWQSMAWFQWPHMSYMNLYIYIFLHKWGLLLWITSALRHPKLMGPSYSLVLRCQNILEYLDHIRTLNEMWLILWTIQSHGPWVLGLLGFGPWDATACRRRRWTWKKIVSSSCGNLGCTWPKNTRLYRMKLGVSFELLFHLLPYCFLL